VQKANAEVVFQLRQRLARRLGCDALRQRGAPDAAELDGLGEGGNRAKLVDRHLFSCWLPEAGSSKYKLIVEQAFTA
jgi:hypothetical protein